ncbi:unnamed protein product [Ilex paraguariensis]|uniref:Transmembrane protein n=1 Tax=Ilex paraguariensis TaxID=185542 RepID=A0ABC8UDW8_9AQUA
MSSTSSNFQPQLPLHLCFFLIILFFLFVGFSWCMDTSYNSQPQLPLHLCFFLLILFMFVGLPWYMNCESLFGGLFDQIRLVLILSPLLLLLALYLISRFQRSLFFIPWRQQDSLSGAGGTPWGVALLLVFLFFVISYQSNFRDRWYPLLSR